MKGLNHKWRHLLDPYKRYQSSSSKFNMDVAYPAIEGHCACGCGKELTGRQRKWGSKECSQNAVREVEIIKGNSSFIRSAIWRRDGGVCAICEEEKDWHADHIVEVRDGGGACTLDNFQTLCVECHKKKTKSWKRK